MPLAVTHVLTTIILVDVYRHYIAKHKKLLTLHLVLIAGIAGLLPDIDILIGYFYNLIGKTVPELFLHGGITHTPFFALIFLIPGIILWKLKKQKIAAYFFVITFGILLHIFLDYLIGGGRYEGIMWFFPFSMTGYKIHLLTYFGLSNLPAALDAVILILWLWHEEAKHKIKDFI